MDHERLTRELFHTLRGRRSQLALSRRLGYKANVAYAWESGRRAPPASALFRLAALNRKPLVGLAAFGFDAEDAHSWSSQDTAALLRALAQRASTSSIARAAAVDRTTAARWLRGATEPSVPELLRCVDALTQRLIEFTELFADARALPSTERLASVLDAQRRIAYEEPLSHAVLRALELASYKALPAHVPGVIAAAIGVTCEEEQTLLARLRKARLIELRSRKWRSVRVLTVDTRVNAAGDQRLKEYFANLGLARLRTKPRGKAYFSYNLFAVSYADLERIRELHLEYYERTRHIVSESRVAECVVLLNQHLIPLGD